MAAALPLCPFSVQSLLLVAFVAILLMSDSSDSWQLEFYISLQVLAASCRSLDVTLFKGLMGLRAAC